MDDTFLNVWTKLHISQRAYLPEILLEWMPDSVHAMTLVFYLGEKEKSILNIIWKYDMIFLEKLFAIINILVIFMIFLMNQKHFFIIVK